MCRRKIIRCCVLSLLILVGFNLAAAEFKHPVLRVPKLTKPPVIDGKIEPGEWEKASAITGFAAGGPGSTESLVPEVQQVVWYLGYDDTYLYLAMRSPHPRGTYPVARVKEDDNIGVLFEDHVEIQICPFERDKATRPGVGFFKIMVNPKGAMIDQYLFNGTPGTEELWSTGGETKCSVTQDYWDLELSVEIARLKVTKLEGRSLVMQLVRTDFCGGIYFAGWVNAPWLSWGRFAEVQFEEGNPVFQFQRLGEVMAGELNTLVTITGTRENPVTVDVEVMVENAEGKVIYQNKQSATVSRGQSKSLNWVAKNLPVSPVDVNTKARNYFEIVASYKEGGKTYTLYHNRSPFLRFDEGFRKKYLEPWLAGRPQSGEWEYRFAYLPYSNKAEVSVDLDFFGVPPAIQKAESFSVKVRKKGAKEVISQGKGLVTNLTGCTLLSLPELPDGEYEALIQLLDSTEKKVLSEKIANFQRKHYVWERNTIGLSDEVIPPFTPVEVKGNNVSVWGRTYSIGGNGLPQQITVAPPTGNLGKIEPLLAAPIRLELLQAGKVVPFKESQIQLSGAKHQAQCEATILAAGLSILANSRMDYDGWYQVTLNLKPETSLTAEALDLVIDFRDSPGDRWNLPFPVDTLYVQRMGDGRYGNYFGAIPASPGIHFQSTSLLKYSKKTKDWKSFVPITYIGNGDRGLWFFAWSDAGWELKDNQAMLVVERLKDRTVRARIRLLAGPVSLSGERKIQFALQAAPVKPNDSRYRTRLSENFMAHDTRGYRYWGDSVDGYALHREEDFHALRKFLLYGPREQKEGQEYRWWVGHYVKQIQEGARIALYGSTWMTGMGPEEFKTFGGEWLGKSNWKANRNAATDAGRWNYQGTIQWTTDEQLTPTGVNWTKSQTDNFVWYHKLLIEKCGVNGTWWDNSSIGTVREYDPELGRMDEKWNLIYRRELCKRLNVMGWELMRPPCWIMNMHVDMPWNQVFWMVENDWYADAEDITALEQWTLDEFRAMTRTKSTTLIPYPWFRGYESKKDPALDRKIKRSVDAICLSHDIPRFSKELKKKLEYVLDYSDTAKCLFAGYWQTSVMVQPAGKEICASVYQNAERKTAVIIFFNASRQDQYLAGTTFDATRLLGSKSLPEVKKIYDLETGQAVETSFENGLFKLTSPFRIDWHDYRILAVEAE